MSKNHDAKLLDEIEDIVIGSTTETVEADIERVNALINKMSEGLEKLGARKMAGSLYMLKSAKENLETTG